MTAILSIHLVWCGTYRKSHEVSHGPGTRRFPDDRPDPAYLSLSQAARRFPSFRGGRPVHTATVTRWITSGIRLGDGIVLKLAAKRLPGRWVTWDGAIEEFVDRLTADRTGADASPPPRATASRERAISHADAELARLGI